jgi:hypothetical protein
MLSQLPVLAQETVLSVYLTNTNAVGVGALAAAKSVTTTILRSAGVTVQWRTGLPKNDHDGELLQIEFVESVPARFVTGAMAYATPYRQTGTCIHISYERVLRRRSRQSAPVLLGYVMAHEIAHILEGVARHSESGVMKPDWGLGDYDQMDRGELRLAPEDIELIRSGMENRRNSRAVQGNRPEQSR